MSPGLTIRIFLGMTHLHILVLFHRAYQTRNRSAFDFVCGKHGNYQPAKHLYAVVNYLRKSDQAPLSFGQIPNPGEKKSGTSRGKTGSGSQKESKSMIHAKALLSGSSTLPAIMKADPGYYMLNKRKLEEFASACKYQRLNDSKLKWPQELIYSGDSLETQRIVEWLRSNIGCTRSLRQKQLFVHGPKRFCKSTLIELLRAFLRLYEIPKAEEFYDFYDDDQFDLAYMDEFKGHKQIQWFNQFLDGSLMTLRKKGAQILKVKNLPVVTTANFPMEKCYAAALEKDPNKLDTLLDRLEIVELTSPLDSLGLALALGLTSETFPAMRPWMPWATICEEAAEREARSSHTVVQVQPAPQQSWAERKRNFCSFCGMSEKNCRCKEPESDISEEM